MRIASKTLKAAPDTSIAGYTAKRDSTHTPEPQPSANATPSGAPIFVVQRHQADRAGLHYDFRLEHNGILWSWAVPKGPSLDPSHKRMAIHVEDHPIDYATFAGEIAQGYGAGTVEVWDHGTWTPLIDPDYGMQKGHLQFTLQGARLHGEFSLVRMKPRGRSRQEAWLLVKDADDAAREDGDDEVLDTQSKPATPSADQPPIPGAIRAKLPNAQKPQLCVTEYTPRSTDAWISELKFDGYRLIARIEGSDVRLLTREGHDWTSRIPHLAQAFAKLNLKSAMLDGELVVLRQDGTSDFGALQNALSTGRERDLLFYAFDLLHLDGWDLRPCRLDDRKSLLRGLSDWKASLRYSDHHEGNGCDLFAIAAERGLEGIVMKRRDSPYRGGRHASWVKIKNLGRAEFVIIGWTKPARSRIGFGALQLATYDANGALNYAGGVGTGFSDAALKSLRTRLDPMALTSAPDLVVSGEKPPRGVTWVRPDLVAEISFTEWSNGGRLRHPVFLGLREDKSARDVIREKPAPRKQPEPPPEQPVTRTAKIVFAQAPKHVGTDIAGIHISHPDRQLWPGITKQMLAEYWNTVAKMALPGIAHRPLAILRCPDGIDGEQFFQKHRGGFMPAPVREASSNKQPYLAIDDVAGLIAMAQMSAIELHTWGADEADPLHPDRLVFDLDPGEGVPWPEIIKAAHDIRARLELLGLESFCRTSGGKGLHIIVPLARSAGWPTAKAFCRGFAEQVSAEEPKRFLAHTKIADRKGRILIDWLRNGPGATAIASFSPRARPGATVATPLDWQEVTDRLDPKSFTITTVPGRIANRTEDPWANFGHTAQNLPSFKPKPAAQAKPSGSRIVVASKPEKK